MLGYKYKQVKVFWEENCLRLKLVIGKIADCRYKI